MRIVNGNRSLNAIISFDIPFHISIANEQKDKLIKLRSLLEKYVRDFPNHWKCVIYCRVGQLDVELEKASIDIAFQHQSSWQDLGRIMVAKADLICHVYELSKILEASYSHTPKPKLLYYGGSLKDGRIKDYRKDLTTFDNIKYHEDPTHDIKNDSFISLLEHGVKS